MIVETPPARPSWLSRLLVIALAACVLPVALTAATEEDHAVTLSSLVPPSMRHWIVDDSAKVLAASGSGDAAAETAEASPTDEATDDLIRPAKAPSAEGSPTGSIPATPPVVVRDASAEAGPTTQQSSQDDIPAEFRKRVKDVPEPDSDALRNDPDYVKDVEFAVVVREYELPSDVAQAIGRLLGTIESAFPVLFASVQLKAELGALGMEGIAYGNGQSATFGKGQPATLRVMATVGAQKAIAAFLQGMAETPPPDPEAKSITLARATYTLPNTNVTGALADLLKSYQSKRLITPLIVKTGAPTPTNDGFNHTQITIVTVTTHKPVQEHIAKFVAFLNQATREGRAVEETGNSPQRQHSSFLWTVLGLLIESQPVVHSSDGDADSPNPQPIADGAGPQRLLKIVGIHPTGPAAAVGIRIGDYLRGIDGYAIRSETDAIHAIRDIGSGRPTFIIMRHGSVLRTGIEIDPRLIDLWSTSAPDNVLSEQQEQSRNGAASPAKDADRTQPAASREVLEFDVKVAESEVKVAEANLANTQMLVEKKVVSESNLEPAKLELLKAQRQLLQAKALLEADKPKERKGDADAGKSAAASRAGSSLSPTELLTFYKRVAESAKAIVALTKRLNTKGDKTSADLKQAELELMRADRMVLQLEASLEADREKEDSGDADGTEASDAPLTEDQQFIWNVLGMRLEPQPEEKSEPGRKEIPLRPMQVVAVKPAGPADDAGVRVGDYLTGMQRHAPYSDAELATAIRELGAGRVEFFLIRDGRQISAFIKLDPYLTGRLSPPTEAQRAAKQEQNEAKERWLLATARDLVATVDLSKPRTVAVAEMISDLKQREKKATPDDADTLKLIRGVFERIEADLQARSQEPPDPETVKQARSDLFRELVNWGIRPASLDESNDYLVLFVNYLAQAGAGSETN